MHMGAVVGARSMAMLRTVLMLGGLFQSLVSVPEGVILGVLGRFRRTLVVHITIPRSRNG